MSPCKVQTHMHRKILKLCSNEKLNDKVYRIFKEMFINTNLELSAKVQSYNIEIAEFI